MFIQSALCQGVPFKGQDLDPYQSPFHKALVIVEEVRLPPLPLANCTTLVSGWLLSVSPTLAGHVPGFRLQKHPLSLFTVAAPRGPFLPNDFHDLRVPVCPGLLWLVWTRL
jgi:hypothetical protein